jgi:PAS domain S-box-containing protein
MPLMLPESIDPRRSLRARFALVLGGCGLAFALLASLVVDRYQREQLLASLGQAMQGEAMLLSRGLNLSLQERLQQVRQTASQTVLASGLMEPGDVRELLEALRAQQPELAWLAVTNEQGMVQVATNTLQEGSRLDDPRWLAESLKGPWLGERRLAGGLVWPLGLDAHGQPLTLIDIGTPLIDYQGRTRGVLAARLRWDWLESVHKAMQDGERRFAGTDSLVIDREGRVLLGPPETIGQTLEVPGLPALLEGGDARVLDWPDGGRFLTAVGRNPSAIAGPSASLTVLVRQPADIAFAAADGLRHRLLGLGLLASLVFATLSIWLAGRIVRPVQALSLAAARSGRGETVDFSAITPGRRDEVGLLARALQALQQELAQRLAAQGQARARFETLLQYAPVAIVYTQGETVQMANQAALLLFGARSLDQLVGQRVAQLTHPDDSHRLEARWRQLEQHGSGAGVPPSMAHRIVRLDGSVAHVESTTVSVDFGSHRGVQFVLHDVSEQRRAQDELRQREMQLAYTSRLAHVGGWSLDVPSQEATWTAEMARIYELPPDTQPSRDLALSYFRGEHRSQLEAAIRLALHRGEPYDLELELCLPDGRRKWVRAQCQPLREGGRTVRLTGFTQDITDRRAAQEALRELNAELEQRVSDRTAQLRAANAELDSFAYAVSHDLRAPLRALSGFSQALIEDHGPALDAEAQGYLEHIKSASRQMGELIDGLLALSRSTRGELRFDDIDLSALAGTIILQLQRQDPQRVVDVAIEAGLHARGDRRMIDAALSNLLGNAWKYSGRCAHPRITLTVREIDHQRWFCITDNGAGFDEAHAGRLFKAFARLHRQDEFPGLGIGLATVQRIVHRHGGQIAAEGRPGQGACFRFTLPEPRAVDTPDSASA